jgi:hypothetical protein
MLKAIHRASLCPMPTPHRRRDRKPDRRRALQRLGAAADGYTEGLLRAHGVTIGLIAELLHAGLATKCLERVVIGATTIEVARVRITDAGRRVLTESTT